MGSEVADRSLDDRLTQLEWARSSGVEARLQIARQVEEEATSQDDSVAAARARLVVADMLHRVGDIATATAMAVEVHTWASTHNAPLVVARSHLVLSSIFEGIGDPAASLDHAVRAVDQLDNTVAIRERGVYLLRLADALAFDGSEAEARRWYAEAQTLFTIAEDHEQLLILLNNLTVLESECGDGARAAAAAAALQRACSEQDMNSDFAETIARAHLVNGEFVAAEHSARDGKAMLARDGDTKATAQAEMALTLAEILLAQARLDEAQAELAECVSWCDRRSLSGMRVAAMEVAARLHAARGDHQRAYDAHRDYHSAEVALRSQQNRAAARTREALFRTTEARRQAELFRMQARVDPLTEVYNRRFVDETLPMWLADIHDAATHTLSVVLIDLDHFKQVNDLYSHPVGDGVIRAVALHLTDSLAPASADSFVARLGGEEFLVVHRSTGPQEIVEWVDRVRHELETRDWTDLAPGLQLTISAGVVIAHRGETQEDILQRADRLLYAAKAAGRNCAVAEDL